MRFFVVICYSLFLFTACLEVNKGKYQQTINELLSEINSMQNQVDTIFTEKADSLLQIRCGILAVYKTDYPSDTITIETAQHIENLKFSCSNLTLFLEQKETLKQIELYRQELMKLQTLIQQGEGERSSYSEWIEEEKLTIRTLQSNFEQIQRYYQNGMRNFGDSERYLDSLIHFK